MQNYQIITDVENECQLKLKVKSKELPRYMGIRFM